jgi:hypothetical protein
MTPRSDALMTGVGPPLCATTTFFVLLTILTSVADG